MWDQEEQINVKKCSQNRLITCKNKKETMYTIKNGKIVEVDSNKKECDRMVGHNKGLKKTNCNIDLKGLPFVNTALPSDSNYVSKEINANLSKLTDDEIRNLPRFKNYQRGAPSKVSTKKVCKYFMYNVFYFLFSIGYGFSFIGCSMRL